MHRSIRRSALCAGLAAGIALAGTLPAIAAPSGTTAGTSPTALPSAAQAGSQNYLVLYKSGGRAAGKSLAAIAKAGGTLVQDYSAIGVAVVRSAASDFSSKLRAADPSVDAASSTASFGVALKGDADSAAAADPIKPPTPAPGADTLSGLQWDMDQMKAPEARAISGGSTSVVVGDIDTGLDWSHPDLAPNVDFSKSVSCVDGIQNTDPSAWMDDNGHGTHTAGTIAAAKNGVGIVGVAPNVKLAGIKAGNAEGFFFPEAVVCSFMWAAENGIQVTNNSYFVDPWLYNCKNDPDQRAIWEAERRAIRYAQSKGTTVVAAAGNESDDLSHPVYDQTSPDNTTPVTRDITNACAVVPTEIPGVVAVSATGNKGLKSFYSSYGLGVVDVAAPGGDSRQVTASAVNGRVLSTYPSALMNACLRKVVDASGATYCYLQGTSMASPHVAGLAALIVSSGVTSPGAVAARIANTADATACPTDMSLYAGVPGNNSEQPQTCTGGTGNNSFYGKGQVNALAAIGG
ncbi:S8 family serine peptidase [Sinomonas sp. R1AF57]|uniref:S8 family serine peptidase n=1 Tax=Sinomonas sp. R1AF57 TaxID=2020377 RepID=UPI000B612F49|nr:S8 family serine peptidase [Sinomonas sp. R1AF57]ASN53263.1 peptidase S8 [Sinomonas sp. R1AF57]